MVRSDREAVGTRTDAELLRHLAQVAADEEYQNLVSRELWDRWWPALNNYLACRFPGVGRHSREDAAALTLSSVLLDPSSYEPARGKLGPYLRTIAYRQLLDLLEQRQNWVAIDSVVIPAPAEEEGAVVQTPGFAGVIALNMLDQMTEADRDTIRLWSRGYRHAEIAEYIGATADAVRVRLHRIRKRIRAAAKGWI